MPTRPAYKKVAAADSPFGGLSVIGNAHPSFVDLDGDGDLDLMVGASDGLVHVFPNAGSSSSPVFPGEGSAGDLDGDGVADATTNSASFDFEVDAGAYDPDTSPAAFAAALATEMGDPFTADDVTVTAVQNADGTWTVSAELDSGKDAAAAQDAADKITAMTPAQVEDVLGLSDGSVNSKTDATVTPAFGEIATNTVSFKFLVDADSYDEATSPAAFAAALATEMGAPFTADDLTVTAVDIGDGTWVVSAELDAGDDAAAAQSAADKITAMTPAELATVLGLSDGSVPEIKDEIKVEKIYGEKNTGGTPLLLNALPPRLVRSTFVRLQMTSEVDLQTIPAYKRPEEGKNFAAAISKALGLSELGLSATNVQMAAGSTVITLDVGAADEAKEPAEEPIAAGARLTCLLSEPPPRGGLDNTDLGKGLQA